MLATLIGLCIALLLISAIWLGALTEFSRSKLERYCSTRNREVLSQVLEHDDDVVLALRNWIRILLLGLAVLIYMDQREKPVAAWIGYWAAVWLGVVIAENALARPIGEAFAERVLYWSWSCLDVLRIAILPLIWLERSISDFIHEFAGQEEPASSALQEEIRTVVNEGEREGQVMPDAAEMIEGLMDLHQVEVGQIMTPRTDLVMFPVKMTIDEARSQIAESGHSRVPVYGNTRDEIVGLLYAKDLLPHINNPGAADLSSLQLRDPLYVKYVKPVDVLLREFQKGGIHLAIVLDDYGGVAGVVTIEDIMEEIVGDIKDEYDEDERPPIEAIDEQSHDVSARLDIDSVNEALSLELPDGPDYDTLGGFVVSSLGRIPRVGESFELSGIEFSVVDATDRFVSRLRLRPISPSSTEEPQPEGNG